MSTESPAAGRHRLEDEFTSEHHVYEPHKVGLPPIGSYLRELWRRREFAVELARTNLRTQHFNTVFGQLWLVINPILLAGVYFVLVDILRSGSRGDEFFAHLMAGLFAYYFVQQSLQQGVRSVTSGGRLILNTAFPRALLPISSVVTAFLRFVPTFLIYIPVHLITGLPVGPELLWLIPVVLILAVFTMGMTMLVAAGQVYFRDIKNFLPYATRIWLYATPILYYAREVPDRYDWMLTVNPLAPIITSWSAVIDEGRAPPLDDMLLAAAWAVGVFLVAAVFFISREREFAVRL
jgi:teichoic acid transport system permease protein